MGKGLFSKGLFWGIAWMIIFVTIPYAYGEDEIRLQGWLMGLNLEKKILMINEGSYILGDETIINNVAGSPISIRDLKPNSWVYIEGEKDKVNKRIMVKKIYLLPKYISYKEQNRYPFMQ